MTRIRRAAVAGYFYPDDLVELAAMIDAMLAAVHPLPEKEAQDDAPPVALIAPHAGYVYSGPVAATAYARLAPWRDVIHRVVVVGPPHHVPVAGLALSSADWFATPLGVIPADTAARDLLAAQQGVYIDDRAHAEEHSVEVHLPFLQRVLGDEWSLVAGLAGDASATAIADALAPLWGAPNTLVVISTDLSHYHRQETARRLDAATADAIRAARWEGLQGGDACGAIGVCGALELVRRNEEHVELLDLRNSGDTAGTSDRVVGYGSFAIR
jgi:AmmeMemoRadiSam system protein B